MILNDPDGQSPIIGVLIKKPTEGRHGEEEKARRLCQEEAGVMCPSANESLEPDAPRCGNGLSACPKPSFQSSGLALSFPECHIELDSYSMQLLQTDFFHLAVYI